jgi:hypothetical protein
MQTGEWYARNASLCCRARANVMAILHAIEVNA